MRLGILASKLVLLKKVKEVHILWNSICDDIGNNHILSTLKNLESFKSKPPRIGGQEGMKTATMG
jgi:hypothetical protein